MKPTFRRVRFTNVTPALDVIPDSIGDRSRGQAPAGVISPSDFRWSLPSAPTEGGNDRWISATASTRSAVFVLAAGLVGALSGCRGGYAMLERPKGEIEMRRPEALGVSVRLSPPTSSLSKDGIDVTVRYATTEDLDAFFSNEKIFGKLASKSPYPQDTLVFYVKIANHSGRKIQVIPEQFVLIDNLNIQYAELSADDISALYDSKASVWSFAKTTGDLAPGYYGAPFKVAGTLGAGGGGRKLHYLIKQVRLAAGYVYPGIAYDGYVAFPRPHPNAASLRLLLHNIKMDFNPADVPSNAAHFEFPLTIEQTSS